MSEKEKEKFIEHINKFSKEQIVGWLSAITFMLPMKEVDDKLANKLTEMFDICSEVIDEKE